MDHLLHWFVPHHSNNHKARILHPGGLFLLLALVISFQIIVRFSFHRGSNILGTATNMQVERLLNRTNEERKKAGLTTLQLDPSLNRAAQAKAEYMFARNYWAHNAPDGTTPWVFFRQVGYTYLHAGENLAKEFDNADQVVDAWIASPSHRANVLRPDYKDIGFAVVNGTLQGEETTLVVQLFGTKQSYYLSQTQAVIPEEAVSNENQIASSIQGVNVIPGPSWGYQPHLSAFQLAKFGALAFAFVLILIMSIDGIVLWKKKAVRLSSHNLAHIVFIASLIAAIWFTGIGIIL